MVFSLWSEKCLKAVEGHTYYNKTKGRNNRASILKSSDIQHIIALAISVWIRRAAEGRRHLNPAVLFSIHNERDAGSCSPAPFCRPVVNCVEMPVCQPTTAASAQFVADHSDSSGFDQKIFTLCSSSTPKPGSGDCNPQVLF